LKATVIKQNEIEEKNIGVIKIKQLVNSSELPNMSAVIIKLNGKNKKNKHTVSDTFYFVLKGQGHFYLDKQKYSVEKGDLIVIPHGTIYQDEGDMTLLSICNPRFDADTVEILSE
jgi:mannose-6-phosphate isomerase-like protein (cupin superfamily)